MPLMISSLSGSDIRSIDPSEPRTDCGSNLSVHVCAHGFVPCLAANAPRAIRQHRSCNTDLSYGSTA